MRSLIVLFALLVVALGAERRNGRIVGGWPVDIEKRPFQVAITGVAAPGVFGLSCGGSLITSRHIITAAHCFPGAPSFIPIRYIRAGSNYFNAGGVISRVTVVVNAPTWDPPSGHDDISILAIETPIFANGHTIAYGIIGNPNSVLSDGLVSIVSGWGTTSPGGSVSVQLLEVELNLINWQLCHDRYEERDRLPAWWSPLRRLTDHMICAGILDEGGADACQGDSGGPLTVQGAIYGLVSWGYSCADDFFPGVNSAVQPHVDWVVLTVASI